MPRRETIAKVILEMTAARGAGKSICPSEVARRLAPDDWRGLMPRVREVAGELSEAGNIRVTQRGETVDVKAVRGAVRLSAV